MGNTALKRKIDAYEIDDSDEESWSSRRQQQVVTVQGWDGASLEFAREFKVSKLLKDYPGCAVCRAAELGSVGKAKMLSPETALKRGETYLLLPRAQQVQDRYQKQQQRRKAGPGARSSKVSPLTSPLLASQEEENSEAEEIAPQTIRIRMTKKQLAKMMGDGSLLLPVAGRSSSSSREAHDLIRNTSRAGQLKDPGLRSSSMKLFNRPQTVQNNNGALTPSIQSRWSPELDSIVEVASQ